MSDIDDESDNHDETNAFTCDDIDDDESDKSLTIKRVAGTPNGHAQLNLENSVSQQVLSASVTYNSSFFFISSNFFVHDRGCA